MLFSDRFRNPNIIEINITSMVYIIKDQYSLSSNIINTTSKPTIPAKIRFRCRLKKISSHESLTLHLVAIGASQLIKSNVINVTIIATHKSGIQICATKSKDVIIKHDQKRHNPKHLR